MEWFINISKSLDLKKVRQVTLQDISGKESKLFDVLKCFKRCKKLYYLHINSKFGLKRKQYIQKLCKFCVKQQVSKLKLVCHDYVMEDFGSIEERLTFGEDSNPSEFLLPIFALKVSTLDITYLNFGELVLL